MLCILLCVTFLHFVDGIIVQNQQCNDTILQTYAQTNDMFTKQFVNTQSEYLFRFDTNTIYTLPYQNSGVYIVFNTENEHQVIVTFPETGVLLTGIQFSEITGENNAGCVASTTSIQVSYILNGESNVILFDSVEGERDTFSLYTRRSIHPIFANTVTFQFPNEINATICAQFELFGCIASESAESLEIPGVIETIYPIPDNAPADYTGECGTDYCNGGTGVLTNVVIDGVCNTWTRNANSKLTIWFALSFPTQVKMITVSLDADVFDKEYTVGLMTEGQATVNRTVGILASITTFQLVTEQFFSTGTADTSFIQLELTNTDPGQFRICEVEIQNDAGVINSLSTCKIDEMRNIICTEAPNSQGTSTATAVRTLPENVQTVTTTEESVVTLDNGRTLVDSSPTTGILETTQTDDPMSMTEPTSTSLPLNVEFYAILGVGLFATLLLLSLILITIVTVLSIYVRNRKKKTARKLHEFPWGNCEIYSVHSVPERENNLFERIVVKDQVFYVRTPEAMKQFPNLPTNPVYELVEDRNEFRLHAGSSCDSTPTLSSPKLPGGVAVVDGNIIPLYEELT